MKPSTALFFEESLSPKVHRFPPTIHTVAALALLGTAARWVRVVMIIVQCFTALGCGVDTLSSCSCSCRCSLRCSCDGQLGLSSPTSNPLETQMDIYI